MISVEELKTLADDLSIGFNASMPFRLKLWPPISYRRHRDEASRAVSVEALKR